MSDTLLYSPRRNGVAKLAVQIAKRCQKFFNKTSECSPETYIDKVLFSHTKSSNSRGNTTANVLLGQSLRNPMLGFHDVGQNFIYKLTVNHEPRELTYIIWKGRNTAWFHDNNRSNLANDGKIAPIPTTTEIKTETAPNNSNGVRKFRCPVFTPYDYFNAIPTELNPTQQKATVRSKRNWT